jgi:hypothetical protein
MGRKNFFLYFKKMIRFGYEDGAGILESARDGDKIQFLIPVGYE